MIVGSLICGAIVGLSLGLTGGGGALIAVPMLVYLLGRPVQEAVSISLASVGATALVGFLARWRVGAVEFSTGLLFAVAGLIGAPLGTILAGWISPAVTMVGFAGLMVLVASRLWLQARSAPEKSQQNSDPDRSATGACDRDRHGRLAWSSRCAGVLVLVGLATGVLTGLFGVGGGFVIVPALMIFSRMSIRVAVGTSLLVVAIVSSAGIASQLVAGRTVDPVITLTFLAGGLVGLVVGQSVGGYLPERILQQGFAVAMVIVAGFVIANNVAAVTF